MNRRPHKKSRTGCLQCKQRHIKCDEVRPVCLLCVNTGRSCSFDSNSVSGGRVSRSPASPKRISRLHSTTAQNHDQHQDTYMQDSRSPTASSIPVTPGSSSQHSSYPPDDPSGTVNLMHLNLFQHVQGEFLQSDVLGLAMKERHKVATAITNYALDSSFLMSIVLAMAAFHLSAVGPVSQRKSYQSCAIALQTSGISSFGENSKDNSLRASTKRFLFASMLGIQKLHQALAACKPDDLGGFIEDLSTYLKLCRGVRAQLGDTVWPLLQHTDVSPLLALSSKLVPPKEGTYIPECEGLEQMMRSISPDVSARETYRDAILQMKPLFCLIKSTNSEDTDAAANLIFSWPITIPVEYVNLLEQRRPEALVILAYYGGILHLHSKSWIIGDGGRHMIKSIESYLGSYWQPWLSWPASLIK